MNPKYIKTFSTVHSSLKIDFFFCKLLNNIIAPGPIHNASSHIFKAKISRLSHSKINALISLRFEILINFEATIFSNKTIESIQQIVDAVE